MPDPISQLHSRSHIPSPLLRALYPKPFTPDRVPALWTPKRKAYEKHTKKSLRGNAKTKNQKRCENMRNNGTVTPACFGPGRHHPILSRGRDGGMARVPFRSANHIFRNGLGLISEIYSGISGIISRNLCQIFRNVPEHPAIFIPDRNTSLAMRSVPSGAPSPKFFRTPFWTHR